MSVNDRLSLYINHRIGRGLYERQIVFSVVHNNTNQINYYHNSRLVRCVAPVFAGAVFVYVWRLFIA